MSTLIFPSLDKPRFYISNNKNVINYFINNFLFSGKTRIQLIINILKLILPETLTRFLLKTFLSRKNRLSSELVEILDNIKTYIRNNKEAFPVTSGNYEDIGFIIRVRTWQRIDDKFVIILFKKHVLQPFAVAKVGSLKYKESIELEYNNTKIVHKNLKDSSFSVPEPIAVYFSDKLIVYLEMAIRGTTVSNYLKTKFSNREKQDSYIYILDKSRDFFLKMNYNEHPMTPQEYYCYFYEPIEYSMKTDFGKLNSSKLNELKSLADQLQETKLCAVWMHGDLWGGSILYYNKRIGVIDWEFFTKRGVPFWDFFSLAFHIGTEINQTVSSSDFMNYFLNQNIAKKTDEHLLLLSGQFQIDQAFIPFLFQSYLLYNMRKRDTKTEHYWQNCLESYWELTESRKDKYLLV